MNPPVSSPALRLARWGVHLLVSALLVIAVARSINATAAPRSWAVLVAAVAVGLVYGAGPLTPVVSRSLRAAAVWLAVLEFAWLVLLTVTPDGIWLAFPLYFLQLHLLPRRWAAALVVLTTVLAIAGFGWHQGQLQPGYVMGPVLGAGFAVATVWGYQTLFEENERRPQTDRGADHHPSRVGGGRAHSRGAGRA